MFNWLRGGQVQEVPDQWVNTDPDMQLHDPALKALFAYWQAKRAGRAVTSRDDIDIDELRARSANLMLIDLEHAPLRLRYRFLGTNITAAMDRDATGSYYDELYEPAVVERIYEEVRWIIAHRAPLRVYGRAFNPDKRFYDYEAVHLPLADDDKPVDMMLGGVVFRLSGA